jgi:hypothetical protein
VRLVRGLADGLGRGVEPDEPGAGAGGELQAVPPAPAGQVEQGVAGGQAQLLRHLRDGVPAEQAGRQQVGRQPEVPLDDLVLGR